eukprot:1144311-Pelagomonas_calceolata.AAC.2
MMVGRWGGEAAGQAAYWRARYKTGRMADNPLTLSLVAPSCASSWWEPLVPALTVGSFFNARWLVPNVDFYFNGGGGHLHPQHLGAPLRACTLIKLPASDALLRTLLTFIPKSRQGILLATLKVFPIDSFSPEIILHNPPGVCGTIHVAHTAAPTNNNAGRGGLGIDPQTSAKLAPKHVDHSVQYASNSPTPCMTFKAAERLAAWNCHCMLSLGFTARDTGGNSM